MPRGPVPHSWETRASQRIADFQSETSAQAPPDLPSSIHIAAKQGNLNEVSNLIRSGVDPTRATADDATPLSIAIVEGHLGLVEMLIPFHSELHGLERPFAQANKCELSRNRKFGAHLLSSATLARQPHVLRYLLFPSLTASFRGLDPDLPLSMAGQEFNADTLPPGQSNAQGITPLMLACATRHTESVELLLSAGADRTLVECDSGRDNNALSVLFSAPYDELGTESESTLVDCGKAVYDIVKIMALPRDNDTQIAIWHVNGSGKSVLSLALELALFADLSKSINYSKETLVACASHLVDVLSESSGDPELLLRGCLVCEPLAPLILTLINEDCKDSQRLSTVQLAAALGNVPLMHRIISLLSKANGVKFEEIPVLIIRGVVPTGESHAECTPLELACLRNSTDMVSYFLSLFGTSATRDLLLKSELGMLSVAARLIRIAAKNSNVEMARLVFTHVESLGLSEHARNLAFASHPRDRNTPLHILAMNSSESERVEVMEFAELLHRATTSCSEGIGRLAHDDGSDPCSESMLFDSNAEGLTPLHYACVSSNESLVRWLVMVDSDGGHGTCLSKEFVKRGAKLVLREDSGKKLTPRLWAVDVIVSGRHPFSVHAHTEAPAFSPFVSACCQPNAIIPRLLLAACLVDHYSSRGISIACDPNGLMTPKNLCARDETIGLRRSLADGSRHFHGNGNNLPPLHHASKEAHLEMVGFLVSECGADVNLRETSSGSGYTPLFFAIAAGGPAANSEEVERRYNVVEFLLNNGADPNCRELCATDAVRAPFLGDVNCKIGAPLQLAVAIGDADLVKLLIRKGAFAHGSIDATQSGGDTSVAAQKGTAVQELTPLHIAAGAGRIDLVSILLAAGADPTFKPEGKQGEEHCCAHLLDAGPSPLGLAVRRGGNSDVVALLIAHLQIGERSNDRSADLVRTSLAAGLDEVQLTTLFELNTRIPRSSYRLARASLAIGAFTEHNMCEGDDPEEAIAISAAITTEDVFGAIADGEECGNDVLRLLLFGSQAGTKQATMPPVVTPFALCPATGRTLLHAAAIHDNPVAAYLVASRALQLSVIRRDDEKDCSLFSDLVTAVDDKGWTAAQYALHLGHQRVVRFLLGDAQIMEEIRFALNDECKNSLALQTELNFQHQNTDGTSSKLCVV